MLETLDTIEWNQLTHAYGSAQGVPELLRGLLSEDMQVREEAFEGLFSSICHQGTIYEVTTFVVPFLLELLESPQVRDKPQLLILLQSIATGDSHVGAQDHFETLRRGRDDMEYQARLNQMRIWVGAAREATGEGIPLYLRLLDHPGPEIRAAAAFALSPFREQAVTILPVLLRRWQKERSSKVKAGLLHCVGSLADSQPVYLRLLENEVLSATSPLVRLVAAMALTQIAGERVLPEAIETLIQVVPYPNPLYTPYGQTPWGVCDVCIDTLLALQGLRGEAARYAIPRLTALLPTVHEFLTEDLVATLLHLTFGPPDPERPLDTTSLSAEQRDILTAIAACDRCWPETRTRTPDVSDDLRDYGLPNRRDALAELTMR